MEDQLELHQKWWQQFQQYRGVIGKASPIVKTALQFEKVPITTLSDRYMSKIDMSLLRSIVKSTQLH